MNYKLCLLVVKSFDSCGTNDPDNNIDFPFVDTAICKQHLRAKKIKEFNSREVEKIEKVKITGIEKVQNASNNLTGQQ